MAVKQILQFAGAKMGLNPSAQGSRNVLLRILNEAAEELYDESDPPGSLWEQLFKVNGDQTISLPFFVGDIRAIREFNSQIPWHINQLRPRYNQFNWEDIWRNFRIKNEQALQASIVNESVGVLSVAQVENPPIVITLSGPTDGASLIHETVIMDAVSKQTVTTFTDFTSVTKDRVNGFDVTLSDIDGKTLTVLPNTELTARYLIVDVSMAPWLPQDVSPQDNYVEVLYKKRLFFLSNDADEFPAFGYDNIIVNKMLQLWYEEQGKPELALAYDSKATRSTARKRANRNKATEDRVSLVSNPHDTMLRRIGSGFRRSFGFSSGRRP